MDHSQQRDRFVDQVAKKEHRKLKDRQGQHRSIWYGFGMFGLVGWSVAIPTLIGIAIGIWIDQRVEKQYSFTLMGLAVGIAVGCLIAWYWVKRESGIDEQTDALEDNENGRTANETEKGQDR